MFAKSIATKGGDVFRDEFSVAFDGTNDYVETSFIPDYISTNATTAFWIKMNDFSGTQQIGIHNNKRWYHGFDGSNLFIGVANAHNSSSPVTPSPALVAGQWFHYCVTAIGGTATIYINGVAQGTLSYTQSSATDPDTGYMIGARDNSGAGNYMNGNISEVVHYNVGLTANQVKTIYNGREPYNHKEGVASNYLQAWYRMGDGAFDSFIGSYNGLIGNELNTTLASNLVTNGTFDADSNWTKGSGWSIGSGVATASDASGIFEQDISAVTGKIYKWDKKTKTIIIDLGIPCCVNNQVVSIMKKIDKTYKIFSIGRIIEYKSVRVNIPEDYKNQEKISYEIVNDVSVSKEVECFDYETMLDKLGNQVVKKKKIKLINPVISKTKNGSQQIINNFQEIMDNI